jgi:hypothetical protein
LKFLWCNFIKIKSLNGWGLKLGGLETTSLYYRTNLMKIPSLAERAKHLFTPNTSR